MRKRLLAAAAVLMIGVFAAGGLPARADGTPDIYAKAYILMEPTTGRVLAERRARARVYPASMTKLLTAMIVLDYFTPDEVLVVGQEINSVPYDASKAKLAVGEGLTVRNMIRALLIVSGNDAAYTAAVACARKAAPQEDTSTYGRAEKVFRRLMNEKAKALGAKDSNFVKPDGYHDENHYTTAYDMALIARAAMAYPVIAWVCAEAGYEGYGAEPGEGYTAEYHDWTSRNLLVAGGVDFYPYATGLKTGATDEAGECLAASAVKDGVTLISITCDSPVLEDENGKQTPTRWQDARNLLDYGFANYHFETVQRDGDDLGTFRVADPRLGAEETLSLYAVGDFSDFLTKDELARISRDVTLAAPYAAMDEETGETLVQAPVAQGAEVGQAAYSLDGRLLFTCAALAAADIAPRTFNSDVDFYVARERERFFSARAVPYWVIAGLGLVIALLVFYIVKTRRWKRRY